MTGTDEELEALRAHLTLLNAVPRARRRQFVAYEIRCGSCRALVIEIMKTAPRWVALFRWAEEERQDGGGTVRTVMPLDDRVFHPLNVEVDKATGRGVLTDRRLLRIPANCECTTGDVFLGPIRDSIARGETSALLSLADRSGHFADGIRGSYMYG